MINIFSKDYTMITKEGKPTPEKSANQNQPNGGGEISQLVLPNVEKGLADKALWGKTVREGSIGPAKAKTIKHNVKSLIGFTTGAMDANGKGNQVRKRRIESIIQPRR
jgi:hypothetical protein